MRILKRDSLSAAPLLLGWKLCRRTIDGTIKVRIVETEAYNQNDPASHSYAGLTKRTAPMFDIGGRLYVYFTYGMHYCVNIVTGAQGVGEAVLIRAAQPLEGIDIMKKNRATDDVFNLTNGPGKLSQALGIKDTKFSGQLLGETTIWLEPPDIESKNGNIITTRRVGIKKAIEEPFRFYLKGNKYISRP